MWTALNLRVWSGFYTYFEICPKYRFKQRKIRLLLLHFPFSYKKLTGVLIVCGLHCSLCCSAISFEDDILPSLNWRYKLKSLFFRLRDDEKMRKLFFSHYSAIKSKKRKSILRFAPLYISLPKKVNHEVTLI